ncbi:1-deoxy-D-xylulose-5-phosphate synthase [Actinobacteria bacterium YIM 96077]|uniref:1-deoxy-D-xylulose-5-phosphate synthase n=1 Tax=Phytoactinopolyspora halophila TaxID=1981511 RepID=A0A329R037_9ACTN|nr:1-deoxy-D-xylulose-5-phosphate synthase [Phytoactinopolyspora halophila]AYY13416.1 1-deoxy-D-xylulose-5-phosphate synthase [Actinobacteria bacterium YIM 96077]RAW17349.1 1-deoxy-D-xylulose-5-phosphate synthase [Phytoactinopolyspora halophila]
MGVLDRVREPRDLRGLTGEELDTLAQEIRDVIVTTVSRTSGHLGPNLGVVELTLAVHRVFDSPSDPIVFDTGHQSYVHKLLTGRIDRFDTIRSRGGMSGYPSRAESPHDWVENSHASTALSYADGMAKAFAVRGERHRTAVAVVGDGALTGGMAWEALNNIAGGPQTGSHARSLVMVVNDNGRSYSPTVGGLAEHLAALRTDPRYEQALDLVKRTLNRMPVVGTPTYDALHGLKKGLKDLLAPQGMFEDLGLKYIGPVDGHDRGAVEQALIQAKKFGGPVIVHCITRKGNGYDAALRDEIDHMHSPSAFDPITGEPVASPKRTLTHVFKESLVDAGHARPDIVAITAAMLFPTGLEAFARHFPERCFDVGIAEQHATTSAAGMAMMGLHPVVAVYATFLNRAFDQLLMDCALHGAGVTFVLDRAGITGPDGASHHGMWDMSVLQVIPGLRLAAPRDAARLTEQLGEALDVDDAPTVVRFPGKESAEVEIAALERIGTCDILARDGDDVLLVAVGTMAGAALDAARGLQAHGVGVTVVDPRWVKPIDTALVDLARGYRAVVTVEDNSRAGGVGVSLAQTLRDHDVTVPVHPFGIPHRFIDQGKRGEILDELGLSGQSLAREVTGLVAALDSENSQTAAV